VARGGGGGVPAIHARGVEDLTRCGLRTWTWTSWHSGLGASGAAAGFLGEEMRPTAIKLL
jgi:hypothetical protein